MTKIKIEITTDNQKAKESIIKDLRGFSYDCDVIEINDRETLVLIPDYAFD
jgi:hypothetical protein